MSDSRIDRARRLRGRASDAEKILWRRLRARSLYGHKFVRQEPIGPYIVDFVCRERHLIVEVDGGQHADRVEADTVRPARLTSLGYRVIRFWNNDVMSNIEGVPSGILRALPDPSPRPSPRGARGEGE